MPGRVQNIESTRLMGKILRNKGLATGILPHGSNAEFTPDCLKSGRTIPVCAFHILGQGRPSQDVGIFLWKAVEK
jgi:hypothetical protein